ncbi:hypothetical protein BZG36_05139 [Bifiguratus adelaidae]|uniref:Uncharacterized protein n=1 Tax=Bifiguratus adelaidae TaxID=1938954 RepID=A0A261XVR6_9FUNG|nr:hypothetical protein BZG36_05139 [Bifiguratus adelaidae]
MASVNLNLPEELKVVSLVDWTHDQVVYFLNTNKEVLHLEPDTLQLMASVPKLKGPQAAYLKVEDWRNLGIGLLDAPSLFDAFEKVREIQRERLSLHVLDPKRICRIKKKRGYTPRLGGEGGTLEIGSPRRNAVWEGIDLSDTMNIKRHATVQRLLANVDEEGFFLVRSPPMTGKTSLAQLVERAAIVLTFRQSRPRRIIRMSLLRMGKAKMVWNFEEEFAKLMGGTTWLDFVNECRTAKTLLVIDELQASLWF